MHTLTGHTATVWSLAVHASGVVVSAGNDRVIRVWDLNTERRRRRSARAHKYAVAPAPSLARTGNGDNVDNGSGGDAMSTSSRRDSATLGMLLGDEPTATAAAAAADEVVVVSDSCIAALPVAKTMMTLVFDDESRSKSNKGKSGGNNDNIDVDDNDVPTLLYAAGYDNDVSVFDWRRGTAVRVLKGHTEAVFTVAILPFVVVSGSRDGTVHIWDRHSGVLLRRVDDVHDSRDVKCSTVLVRPRRQTRQSTTTSTTTSSSSSSSSTSTPTSPSTSTSTSRNGASARWRRNGNNAREKLSSTATQAAQAAAKTAAHIVEHFTSPDTEPEMIASLWAAEERESTTTTTTTTRAAAAAAGDVNGALTSTNGGGVGADDAASVATNRAASATTTTTTTTTTAPAQQAPASASAQQAPPASVGQSAADQPSNYSLGVEHDDAHFVDDDIEFVYVSGGFDGSAKVFNFVEDGHSNDKRNGEGEGCVVM
jgi:hypothetical protein